MSGDSSERLVLLNHLADEFAARYRRGERPALKDYIDRHPELAEDIREFFPAMVEVEQAKEDRQEVLAPPARVPPPTLERLGDYRILREIGCGGMGVVYEAEQVSLGRHVALKVLPKQPLADVRTRQRFEREARSAARLHHTNIVPVFGVGEHDGLPYYVMQFIQGLGLDEVLEELKRLQSGAQEDGSAPRLSGGELRVSRTEATADLARRDVSAADVARSLLTGRFPPARAEEEEATTAGSSTDGTTGTASGGAAEDVPSSRIPGAGRLSETFSLSSSSGVLLGANGRPSGKKRPTYWQSVARIGVQVADALQHAHSQGVLHRDIKPSNLLLDAQGTAWVTDFGLAKADDQQNLTHTGDVLGTLRYMPPEAFEGQTDVRSDVYSLGLTLYELLAFRPAFDERDRNRLIKQVTSEEPARLDRVNREVPRDLVTIVHKAIDRDRAHRYQSAGELAADLQRFLDDEPILARRQTQAERYLRWARHNPGVAILGAVLTAVLVMATIASLLAAGHFNRLRRREAQAAAGERIARHEAEEAADEARRRSDAERWERYRSDIAAASGALQLQNSGTARIALDAAPPEHRNWEWQHFHSQLDGARLVLPVPGGMVCGLGLSPSGRQIAAACFHDQKVYLYDVASGRLETALSGHAVEYVDLAYRPDGQQLAAVARSPATLDLWDLSHGPEQAHLMGRVQQLAYSPDGRRFATVGDCTSRLWDSETGKEIAVLGESTAENSGIAFSPDNKRVAVASKEYVRLCDARTGRLLASLGPHNSFVSTVAYSPNGKRIVSTPGSVHTLGTIYLWDAATGEAIATLHQQVRIMSHRLSPDGSRLITSSDNPDNTARLWDAATGRLLKTLDGHKNAVINADFSPDGRRIVTISRDQTARLWDGRSGELIAVLGGHTGPVPHALFDPNSTHVVTASHDATLRLWDARTGDLISVLRGHGAGFVHTSPIFTPDGSELVSGSDDGTVRIWDLRLAERNGILRGHESFVYDVAFSPDGQQVASSAWDGTARLWDATTGRQTGLLKHEKSIIAGVTFSRDGRRLATVERDRGITLWDVAARTVLRTWSTATGYWDGDPRAALNPEATLLACGCAEGPVRLWDVAGGQEVAELKGHEGASFDVAFHPDGRLLASTGQDHTVRLWDVAKRACVGVLRGHTDKVWCVAFSDDGTLLASGSHDKTIRFWDARTGEPLGVTPVGTVIYGLAFSPDNTRLAAGCADSTVRLFDVATREQVAELRGHTDYVHAVAWSPDGTRLVSGSGDTTARVWDALPLAVRARPRDASIPPRGYPPSQSPRAGVPAGARKQAQIVW
jgi:WD40 repeat protein/serine/threonine protein kinase